ncbi:dTDP-4-dehydrorhamnose 3,5-epimerase family protein [Flaviflexus equikiangi]|uniref:dTDP-4-dehydrorhamnose 3,5-epimerase family protein n=1 Tax=Flaviflexus equikiangi TaxID=2758573 RepID=A0ABS2THS4_9ACTO|nr:dTDP-4-dehydrorhamnose 3,5-epimerase family protein [Flaviflexus equikiangi]MBM9434214.1 dTDP-4-dehydrorhamnose 3,5-epimerase family protein [Flaviflexus equikiangi]
MQDVVVGSTKIPGLKIVQLTVRANDDGWFKEDWHHDKLTALGFPGFQPVQHNITHLTTVGVTRGFHAEPWDKFISVISGRVFGAWIDLRQGDSYGEIVYRELDPSTSVLVPRGVANAHQVLEAGTTLSYLLNEHWTQEGRDRSKGVNLFDPAISVPWPIGEDRAIVNDRDRALPALSQDVEFSRRASTFNVTKPGAGEQVREGKPFHVLYVCTANICRSAYADVVSRARGAKGIEFSSAGIHGLVDDPIDPPMGELASRVADSRSHVARQLTRDIVDAADLILTMGTEHRRYILDEWPSAARKTFVIGHAAREISAAPAELQLSEVTDYLWRNRGTGPRDEVADPYRRGEVAALKAATEIDTHIDAIIPRLEQMIDRAH